MRKNKGFLVYLPDDLKEAVRGRAEREDLNMNQLIRKAVRAYVATEQDAREAE
jgi:hypothetical protein